MKLKIKKITITGSTFIIIAAILWSLDGLFRGSLKETIPSISLVLFEHLFGIIPLIFHLYKGILEFKTVSIQAKISIITTSLIGGTLATIFYTEAIGIAIATNSSYSIIVSIQKLQPIFAITLAALLLKEKITGKFLVYSVFAIFGAYLFNFPQIIPDLGTELGKQQIFISLLALLAAFGWGSATVFSKNALKELKYKNALALRFFITIISTAIILLILPSQRFIFANLTPENLKLLIIIVLSAGMLSMLFYYKGLQKTQAKISTILELTWPLCVFIIDLIRGINFSQSQLIGVVLLIVMLYKIARINKSTKLKKSNT